MPKRKNRGKDKKTLISFSIILKKDKKKLDKIQRMEDLAQVIESNRETQKIEVGSFRDFY